MEKSRFKKCLHILDKIESNIFEPDSFYPIFLSNIKNNEFHIEKEEFVNMIKHLIQTNNLLCYEDYFDLSQSLSIFSKSAHHSTIEALSIFETLLQNHTYFQINQPISLNDIHPFLRDILLETILLEKKNKKYYFNEKLHEDLKWIQEDIQSGLNCSDCLKTYFTQQLYSHIDTIFKNCNVKPIPYKNINRMKEIYPVHGIPINRDCSKELQVFFKDCLFNEFSHSCVLCHANLPQMLIASHIKPFRDCGYLVEAMDSNNGLLLCRNHDYMFDQGFISFDDEGKILISQEIKDPKLYQIDPNFVLDKSYMTSSRRLFLDYHRKFIFKH